MAGSVPSAGQHYSTVAEGPSFDGRLADFDAHWRRLAPDLRKIEAGRRNWMIGGGLLCLLGAGIFLLSFFPNLVFEDEAIPDMIRSIGWFAGGACIVWGRHCARKPARLAGALIKERVIGFFGLSYRQDAGAFPVHLFYDLGLVPEFDNKHLADHVRGEVLEVPVEFCDAYLTKKVRRGKRTSNVTVFRGPLLISRFPKNFAGKTLIHSDRGAIGNYLTSFFHGKAERVSLESPEFERLFEVYSTDQVEARYLLTPLMMERLVALKRQNGGTLKAAFADDRFLISLDDRRDWFPNPGLFARLTDPALVHEQAAEVARLTGIIESLQLDAETRI